MYAGKNGDMVILVPDKDWESGIKSLLSDRSEALSIRPLAHEIIVHSWHDPGIIKDGPELLRAYVPRFRYAVILFDFEGSGVDAARVEGLKASLEKRLSGVGFGCNQRVFVVIPELENWVWGNYNLITEIIGRPPGPVNLGTWLSRNGYLTHGVTKPYPPKTAFIDYLKAVNKPKSSSWYAVLASRLSVEECADPTFIEFRDTLRHWFPAS